MSRNPWADAPLSTRIGTALAPIAFCGKTRRTIGGVPRLPICLQAITTCEGLTSPTALEQAAPVQKKRLCRPTNLREERLIRDPRLQPIVAQCEVRRLCGAGYAS
jgi:hypothetical protein